MCSVVGLSLDGLLHADHGVPPPVEEDVGGGGVGGTGHQLLRGGLDDAVVTVQPAGVPCININTILQPIISPLPTVRTSMVDVRDIMTLGGLPAGVVDHSEQFVLPLLAGVLALTGLTEDVPPDLQVDTELHLLHHLLTAAGRSVVNEPLQVENQDGRKLLQTQVSRGLHFLFGFGTNVAVQLFRGEILSQGIVNTENRAKSGLRRRAGR